MGRSPINTRVEGWGFHPEDIITMAIEKLLGGQKVWEVNRKVSIIEALAILGLRLCFNDISSNIATELIANHMHLCLRSWTISPISRTSLANARVWFTHFAAVTYTSNNRNCSSFFIVELQYYAKKINQVLT